MPQSIKIIFGLLGGLAIFIYGMNLMSETLQKVAGEKMKKILALLTKNPFFGVIAGALTTAVLQSSSATTVMAIGFVSAGLMNLPQAISIILGANIGTTITAQIIAFKISNYIYLFIFIGFIISFIFKNQKIKNIGITIFAFGLLFLGIETMGSVMKPLAKSPIFTNLIAKVSNVPVLGVLLGTVMTLVVQSSSATIAVLQNFASQPAADGISSSIGLAGAIPILLGDNIGTTITAILASIGQSKDAKRTAIAHSLFNISGCLIFIWIIPFFADFVRMISPKGNEIDVISRQIANAHTSFNIVMTFLWIPFIWLMVKIVNFIIPEKNNRIKDETEPKFLDSRLVYQPVAAVRLVTKEVIRSAELVRNNFLLMVDIEKKKDEQVLEKISQKCEVVDSLNSKISDYMATMFSVGSLNEEQANEASGILYVMNDVDRINQLLKEVFMNIAEHIPENVKHSKKKKSVKNELVYSKQALDELKASLETIYKNFSDIIFSIADGNKKAAQKVFENKNDIMKISTKLRKGHISRVCSGMCNSKHVVSFNTILNDIDRIANSIINIAEVISKNENFIDFIDDGKNEVL